MKRIASIDALRGITIFAMILCATIGYNSNLPAWMFHCQVPPAFGYEFHPEVRGITWVDLVFPFFIFSMGAAIPFSLGSKIDKGVNLLKISLGIGKRWLILMAFAIILGNTDAVWATEKGPLAADAFKFIVWLLLFAALVRTQRKWINIAGWLAVAAAMALMGPVLGVQFDPRRNDCIIRLLATASLWGSFIWMATRNNGRLRLLALLLIAATKMMGWDYLQYLVILLPATIVGDVLRGAQKGSVSKSSSVPALAAIIALAAVFVQLWGLYTRNVVADFCISAVLGGVFLLLTVKKDGPAVNIGWMGFILLILGVAFDPLDGGIAKDFCNMSYLLASCGMAALTLCFLMWMESTCGLWKPFTLTGQNPMLAYKIAFYVIVPVLGLCKVMGWMAGLSAGNQFWGVVQGLVVSSLMVACTCLFTSRKIFWRS